MNALELLKAIYLAYKNDAPLFASLTGGLHLDAAPAGTVFPYAIYSLIGDVPERTFNTLMEDTRIQFNIYSKDNDAAEVLSTYKTLDDLYDDLALVVAGYDTIRVQRGAVAHLERAPGGAWMYIVEYEVLIQKQ